MNYIAHRGLYRGPDKTLENRPSQIDDALACGFDAEVDIRMVDGQLWLGHDEPQYIVDSFWINNRASHLWFHCKDHESLEWFATRPNFNFFFHNIDDYVVTSQGWIWAYPGNQLGLRSICVMPESVSPGYIINITKNIRAGKPIGGICSDFVERFREDAKSDNYTAW